MPIYEYQCSACGHQREEMQKMSDAPLTDCPQCHQPTLTKLVSAAGFQLKGTGWYVTDYSTKGKAKTVQESKAAQETTTQEPKTQETKTKDSGSQSGSSQTSAGTS